MTASTGRAVHPPTFQLADLFEAVADAAPARHALVEGDRSLTFAALDERATRLAHVFADHGVGAGGAVGLLAGNRCEYVEATLAAFKLRAAAVNLNYRYTKAELEHVVADAGVQLIVCDEDLVDLADGGRRPVVPCGDRYEAAVRAASPARDFGRRSGDDHYVLYTGGTTGKPKGVVWRHEDLFFAALAGTGGPVREPADVVANVARTGRRVLCAAPLMHGTGHWMALRTLLDGACVVLPGGRHFDPAAVIRLVEEHQVTFLVIVGDAFARPLLDALDDPGRLASLSVILSGGAVLSPAVKRRLLERLPGVLVVDGFGSSETGGHGQVVSAPGAVDDAAAPPAFRMPPGTAVLDGDLRPLPPGTAEVGLLARRDHIPLGYLNDDQATAAVFPVVDGVRWAVPGDLATVESDGTIRLLGRGFAFINTGGEKVHAHEVEQVLAEHPAVRDVVVVGMPDEHWGERVVALVEPASPGAVRVEELAEHCRVHLASYKCPKQLLLVDHVPRTPSGKTDYRRARQVAAEG